MDWITLLVIYFISGLMGAVLAIYTSLIIKKEDIYLRNIGSAIFIIFTGFFGLLASLIVCLPEYKLWQKIDKFLTRLEKEPIIRGKRGKRGENK